MVCATGKKEVVKGRCASLSMVRGFCDRWKGSCGKPGERTEWESWCLADAGKGTVAKQMWRIV